MNRGIAHQQVFFCRGDGEKFESLLAEGYEDLGVEVHAYCLMTNHFHLLVHCPDGGLSDYMQHVGAEYTRYRNRRSGRDGALFRGRFHSLLVDSNSYLQSVGRYIHRNPLDIRPSVDLAEYRWSSLRLYSSGSAPPWLKLSLAEDHGGADRYRTFVEEDDLSKHAPSVTWAIATAIAEMEADGLGGRSRIGRTAAVLMLDDFDHDDRRARELERVLKFPNSAARRNALSRARRRLAEDDFLAGIVTRARRLAS